MSTYQPHKTKPKHDFSKAVVKLKAVPLIGRGNQSQNQFAMACECGEKFRTTSALTQHIYLIHNPENHPSQLPSRRNETTVVKLKKRRFKTSYQLQRSVERGQVLKQSGKKKYTKRTDGQKQYRKIYFCGACETIYEQSEELRFHLLTIHQGTGPDGTIYGISRDQLMRHFNIPQNGQTDQYRRDKRNSYRKSFSVYQVAHKEISQQTTGASHKEQLFRR